MTTPSHLVLDVFEFTDAEGFLRQNSGARDDLSRLLHNVALGLTDVRHLLRGRVRSLVHRRYRDVETRIHIDNDYSRRYTVLEIVTNDAPGLLYRISRAISDSGCDVDLVLISTEGRKAIDVLHVTRQGRQLDDAAQRALTQTLERMLEAPDEAD